MYKKLYVIGNGFDIHHGLQTSYYHFSQYLKNSNTQLFDKLEKYISYPETEDSLWSRFEENLANLNADEILSDNTSYLPNIASDDFRGGDMHTFPDTMLHTFSELTEGLLDEFKNFILEVNYPKSIHEHEITIDEHSFFLNFNYTNTLERFYNLKSNRINYIHNSVYHGHEEIILGHGIDPKKFENELPTPPDDIDVEDYEDWSRKNDDYDYSYDTGKENLYEYFKVMHKPTNIIIDNNQAFFNNISTVEEIYVFGHSISNVDTPYFKAIFKSINNDVKWTVSYYSPESITSLKNSLLEIGVSKDNISFVRLTEIQVNNTQLKLDL